EVQERALSRTVISPTEVATATVIAVGQSLKVIPIMLELLAQDTTKREAAGKLVELRTEIESLKELIRLLEQEIEERLRNNSVFVEKALGLDKYRIQLASLEEAMKIASNELIKMETEANDPPRVLPFEKATVTHVTDTPRKLRYAGIAASGA